MAMTIKEIFEQFERIGCLTFATVDSNGCPETRIAHLRAYDDEGIYFMTMHTKTFYRQLKNNGFLSICGLCANTQYNHDENGMPVFDNGFAMRMTGTVKEVPIDEIKAKNNPIFDMCVKDHEKYNAMVVFCITSARGDIFDYDFEMESRENKLERIYFAYNGAKIKHSGLHIDTDKCISCGVCKQKCSFLAVKEEISTYSIDINRCDECGDCLINCPVEAISASDYC